MKRFTDHYLRTALLLGMTAAALWTLVALFGFTSLEASGADATATAVGLVICFLAVFIATVLALGTYDMWQNTGPEDVLETALWAAPVQRERLGFVLMAGSLLLLVSAATGAISQPIWPALSGLSLFGGGLILVFTALQESEPISPLAVARTRYRSINFKSKSKKKDETNDEAPESEEDRSDAETEETSTADESEKSESEKPKEAPGETDRGEKSEDEPEAEDSAPESPSPEAKNGDDAQGDTRTEKEKTTGSGGS